MRLYVCAGFQHVNVSELVKEKNLHSGKHEDQELDSETPIHIKAHACKISESTHAN